MVLFVCCLQYGAEAASIAVKAAVCRIFAAIMLKNVLFVVWQMALFVVASSVRTLAAGLGVQTFCSHRAWRCVFAAFARASAQIHWSSVVALINDGVRCF
jgi:hypothetical protein